REMRRDAECEADVHAVRVPLDRGVEKPVDAGELDDAVEGPPDLLPAEAEDRSVQVDVLPPGELGMESRADLEQAAGAPPDDRAPGGRRRDAAQDLQQRRLARAVPPD